MSCPLFSPPSPLSHFCSPSVDASPCRSHRMPRRAGVCRLGRQQQLAVVHTHVHGQRDARLPRLQRWRVHRQRHDCTLWRARFALPSPHRLALIVGRFRGVQGEIGVLDEGIDPPPPRTPSGWDIYDARFSYDPVDDILYVGINTGNCITGDAGALCTPIARRVMRRPQCVLWSSVVRLADRLLLLHCGATQTAAATLVRRGPSTSAARMPPISVRKSSRSSSLTLA